MPRSGWDTVTIPGAVSGWVALSRRFGKLPFADLFAPAIRYARDGYAVSPIVAEKWSNAVPDPRRRSRLRRALSSARPRARSGRNLRVAGDGRIADPHRGHAGRGVLSRRTRRENGRTFALARWRAHARGFRGSCVRLGDTAGARLPRLHRARDPAQRPGHRRADGAGHRRELRLSRATRSIRSKCSICRSKR